MQDLSQYNLAFAALAMMVMLIMGLTGFYGLQKSKHGNLQPGEPPRADYSDLAYRAYRAMINGQESLVLFAAALLVAVGAGSSPFWVNAFALIYVFARIAMVYIHLKGLGKLEGGLRSMAYAVAFFMVFGIVLLGLFAAVF